MEWRIGLCYSKEDKGRSKEEARTSSSSRDGESQGYTRKWEQGDEDGRGREGRGRPDEGEDGIGSSSLHGQARGARRGGEESTLRLLAVQHGLVLNPETASVPIQAPTNRATRCAALRLPWPASALHRLSLRPASALASTPWPDEIWCLGCNQAQHARRDAPFQPLIDGSSEARSRATDRIKRIFLRLRWHPPRAAGHAAIRSAAGARRGCESEVRVRGPRSLFAPHKGDGAMRPAERGKLKVRRAGSGQRGKGRCQRARRGRVQPRSRIRVHLQRVCIRALAPRVVLSVSRLQPAPVDRDLPDLPAPSRILHYPTCLPDIQAVNELISASLTQGGRNAGPCQTRALCSVLDHRLGRASCLSQMLAPSGGHLAQVVPSRLAGWLAAGRRCEISHLRCHRRAEARAAPNARVQSNAAHPSAGSLQLQRCQLHAPLPVSPFSPSPSMPPWKLGSGCAFLHNLRPCAGTADWLL